VQIVTHATKIHTKQTGSSIATERLNVDCRENMILNIADPYSAAQRHFELDQPCCSQESIATPMIVKRMPIMNTSLGNKPFSKKKPV
jgi:hypothetical protein